MHCQCIVEGSISLRERMTENLKKIPKYPPKKIPKNSKKKCSACNDGLIYDGKSYHACTACDGQGFIR